MLHEEEIKTVKQALEFEEQLKNYRDKIEKIENEEFEETPEKPVMGNHKLEEYPPIETGIVFNKWFFLLLIIIPIGWVVFIVLWFDYKKKKEMATESIKNSAEYIELCEKVDEHNDACQKDADVEYEIKLKEYNDLLEDYNKRKNEWEKIREEELEKNRKILSETERRSEDFYSNSVLIPRKYHTVFALTYIYDIVAYSQYTFKEAASDYEIYLNRRLEEEKYHQDLELNQLLKQLNESLAQVDADLSDVSYSINKGTGKIAKTQNIQTIVNGVQNHNRNKLLGKIVNNK